MNPKINYGLWVITIDLCRSVTFDKHTPLVGDVDNREGHAYIGAGHIWQISVSAPQFCCEPETALNKCLNKKKLFLFFSILVSA